MILINFTCAGKQVIHVKAEITSGKKTGFHGNET